MRLIYTDPGCRNQVASGTPIELGTTGARVSVPDDSTTRLYLRAAIGDAVSACSDPFTYVEHSHDPPPAFNFKASKRHCRKKFRGKRRAKCIKRAKEKARRL